MRRSILLSVALTAAVVLPACGEDESSDTLATNSTTSSTSTTAPSTTAAPSTSTVESTTTVASTTTADTDSGGDATVAGKAVLAMASGVTRMDITSCSSAGESSLNLSATDDDGDVLEVRARNDVGVVTYRGPQESREGTTVRITVGEDQGFNVVGALNGEELTLTGKCA
jgi:hypothetical protein